ncbi:MAG: SDR family oxidoreductase, partial [Rhodopila sp.]
MNKVAAVTGAASGIGEAATRRLLKAGWTVYGLDLQADRLEAMEAELSGYRDHFRPIICDVADSSSVGVAFAGLGSGLNALICCAGVLRAALLEDMPIEDFDLVMNTNLRGVYYCIRAFAPMMVSANYGHIVNISSIASKNALPNGAVYSASKWGL